jgi:DNA-binding MarR family transcriptional regulator
MERSDLIERQQRGRANRIYLTARGQGLYEEIVPAHEEMIARHLSVLTDEEQAALLGLLRKLDRSVESNACGR